MSAKIKNIEAYMARLRRIPEAAKVGVHGALAQNASELASAISRACDDDPKMSASVGFSQGQPPAGAIGTGDATSAALATEGLSFTVYAGAGLAIPAAARWREFGTHPHAEDAKKSVMAFDGKDGRAFAAHVDNPGERAQPFFFPTYRAYKKRLNSRASRAGSSAIRKAFSQP